MRFGSALRVCRLVLPPEEHAERLDPDDTWVC
jgi:hypothetical protein